MQMLSNKLLQDLANGNAPPVPITTNRTTTTNMMNQIVTDVADDPNAEWADRVACMAPLDNTNEPQLIRSKHELNNIMQPVRISKPAQEPKKKQNVKNVTAAKDEWATRMGAEEEDVSAARVSSKKKKKGKKKAQPKNDMMSLAKQSLKQNSTRPKLQRQLSDEGKDLLANHV